MNIRKHMESLTIGMIIIFGTAVFCFPAAYYVKNSGNDNLDGKSISNAWKTINRVNITNFQPGDIICFMRGNEWNEQLIISSSGTLTSPIIFTWFGSSGAKPVLSFTNGNVISVRDEKHIIIRLLNCRGGSARVIGIGNTTGTAENISIENVIFDNISANRVIQTMGYVNNLKLRGIELYADFNPVIEAGFYFYKRTDNLVIEDCIFKNFINSGETGKVIYLPFDPENGNHQNIIIRNNDFWNTGSYDISVNSGNNINILTNYFRYNLDGFEKAGDCILIEVDNGGAASGITIERNVCIADANTSRAYAGIWTEGVVDAVICYNRVEGFKGYQFSRGIEAMNDHSGGDDGGTVQIFYNIVKNCGYSGYNGTCGYNGAGIAARGINNGDEVAIHNNTVYNCFGAGILIGDVNNLYGCANIEVYNNIITMTNDYCIRVSKRSIDLARLVFNNNDYYKTTSGNFIRWNTYWTGTGETGISYSNLSVFINVTGKDSVSINVNPLLNISSFTLQSSSPCINKAKYLGYLKDYDGTVVGNYPDIGAQEY